MSHKYYPLTGHGYKYPLYDNIDEAMRDIMPVFWMRTSEMRRRIGWMFRGQCNDEWEMIPTLYRPPVTPEIVAKRKAYTDAFVDDLAKNAKRLELKNPSKDKLIEIAQHYGFYTAFLDFTWNAEVAAYFASKGWETEGIGVIYCFNFKTYERIRVPWKYSLSILPRSKVVDFDDVQRIKEQEGLFLEVEEQETQTLMRNCIDRFYFYQHRGNVYTGGYEILRDLDMGEEMSEADTLQSYVGELKKTSPHLFEPTDQIGEQDIFPPLDPISQFAENWKRNNPDPTKT